MRESKVESYLRRRIAELGGKAYKFTSPSNNGVPDRLCCLPFNMIFFVETKAPEEDLRPLQKVVIKFLRGLGCEVIVADTKEKVDVLYNIKKEELNAYRRNNH